jgi:hypothetical protein
VGQSPHWLPYRQRGYDLGKIQLQRALQRTEEKGRALCATEATFAEAARQISTLPCTVEEYRAQRSRPRGFLRGPSLDVRGVLDFVLQNFQYRSTNVFDYLDTYSGGRSRKVDLIVAHLVDYDVPLAGGTATASPLADQVRVMEQISVLTGGRVHAFAPFDPMKQAGFPSQPSLRLIQDAVQNWGFLGVKLCLTIGFAPFGNAEIHRKWPDFWRKDFLPQPI